jgi:uncharacterized repeat protein (TIGR01451 family)
MATSGTASLSISALVVSPIPQSNVATLTHSDQYDSNPGNNTSTVVETPQIADLVVSKSVDNSTPNVGDIITFTVTLANNGPDSGTHVALSDPLPAGLALRRR